MPEPVKSNVRQIVSFDEIGKPTGESIGVNRGPIPAGEDSPSALPEVPAFKRCSLCQERYSFSMGIHGCGTSTERREFLGLGVFSVMPFPGRYTAFRWTLRTAFSMSRSAHSNPHTSARRRPVLKTSRTAVWYRIGSASRAEMRLTACVSSRNAVSLYSARGDFTRSQGFDGMYCHCTAVSSIAERKR